MNQHCKCVLLLAQSPSLLSQFAQLKLNLKHLQPGSAVIHEVLTFSVLEEDIKQYVDSRVDMHNTFHKDLSAHQSPLSVIFAGE